MFTLNMKDYSLAFLSPVFDFLKDTIPLRASHVLTLISSFCSQEITSSRCDVETTAGRFLEDNDVYLLRVPHL